MNLLRGSSPNQRRSRLLSVALGELWLHLLLTHFSLVIIRGNSKIGYQDQKSLLEHSWDCTWYFPNLFECMIMTQIYLPLQEPAGCNAQTPAHTYVALRSLNIDITYLGAIRWCTERPNCLSVLYNICFVCCRTPVSCGAPWSPCRRPAGWWAVWLKSSQRTTPSTVLPCTYWRLWTPSPLRTDPEKERVVKAPQWTDDKLPLCPFSSLSWRFYVISHFMLRLTHPHNFVVESNDIHSGYDRLLAFYNSSYFHTCNIHYVKKSIVGWICLRWLLRNEACLCFVTSPSVSVWLMFKMTC